MRGRRLQRLLQLIAILRGPTSWNARRLAAHFHTSRRNVYRDLAIMELAGVPFWYDPDFGDGGGYRIRESFFFPHIGLTNQECLDLAVLTRLAESQGISLLDEACHVRDKLLGTLPAQQQSLIAEASDLFDILSMPLTDQHGCRQIMVAVQQALLAKKQVEGTYRSPHESRVARLRLQPLRVFLCNQVWYLAAVDNKDVQTKLYRLSRFEGVRMLDKPLTVDPTFSLRDFLGNAWTVYRGERDYHVEIDFDPDVALLVEECRWHPTQELERRPNDHLVFRATVSGLEEIKSWVLGWGPKALVLKPRELADEVQRLAAATAARYRPIRQRSASTSNGKDD